MWVDIAALTKDKPYLAFLKTGFLLCFETTQIFLFYVMWPHTYTYGKWTACIKSRAELLAQEREPLSFPHGKCTPMPSY